MTPFPVLFMICIWNMVFVKKSHDHAKKSNVVFPNTRKASLNWSLEVAFANYM